MPKISEDDLKRLGLTDTDIRRMFNAGMSLEEMYALSLQEKWLTEDEALCSAILSPSW